MRSKIRWFTEFCNSHYVSHFAAFFIVTRAKISVVESCPLFVVACRRESRAAALASAVFEFGVVWFWGLADRQRAGEGVGPPPPPRPARSRHPPRACAQGRATPGVPCRPLVGGPTGRGTKVVAGVDSIVQ